MLGFVPYSTAAFSDVGNSEQLFVATGVVGNGAIGTVAVTGDQIGLTLGSVQGSASSNGVIVDGGAIAAVSLQTGGVGNVGSVIVAASSDVPVTGVSATGSAGATTVEIVSIISPTGVAGTTNTPSVSISGTATFSVTSVVGTMSVGTAQGQAGAGVDVTGVFATSSVGSITMTGSSLVTPTGVSATGLVGQALVWGRIKPDPDPELNKWVGVTPNTETVWTRIAA